MDLTQYLTKPSVVSRLGIPLKGKYFIEYPSKKEVEILAPKGLVDIVFPSKTTSKKPVSIVNGESNMLIFKEDGKALTGTEIKVGEPQRLYFCPLTGGYVIMGYVPKPIELLPQPVGVLGEDLVIEEALMEGISSDKGGKHK